MGCCALDSQTTIGRCTHRGHCCTQGCVHKCVCSKVYTCSTHDAYDSCSPPSRLRVWCLVVWARIVQMVVCILGCVHSSRSWWVIQNHHIRCWQSRVYQCLSTHGMNWVVQEGVLVCAYVSYCARGLLCKRYHDGVYVHVSGRMHK